MSKYVVVDLEMCKVPKNMKPKDLKLNQETIQIGAVLLNEELEIVDKFCTYVCPKIGLIDSFINNLTGIHKMDVRNAPDMQTALNMFREWMPEQDVKMVAWSDNDERQIRKEILEKNIAIENDDWLTEQWIDCQKIFGEKMHSTRCYSLAEALIAADIMAEGREHDGLADAYNTALLFKKMQREDELQLNAIYESAIAEEETHLGFDLESLLKGLEIGSCA